MLTEVFIPAIANLHVPDLIARNDLLNLRAACIADIPGGLQVLDKVQWAQRSGSAVEALVGFEQALAVDHGKDVDRLSGEFVDQAVTVEEAFTHIRSGEFRYDAPELRVCGQFVGEVEQVFDDLLGVVAGVLADVLGDVVDVIKRLVRSDQGLSHLPRRSLACSCVRCLPSRMSSRPRRIFSMT